MASVLSTCTVSASVNFTYSSTVTGLTNATANTNTVSFSTTLTNGTGAAGTANQLYFAQSTIAASGNTTFNVNTGLTDLFGNAIAMARVKFIYINLATTTAASSIAIGNATNPLTILSGTTPTATINNGGVFLIGDPGATGYVVTGASHDTLKLLNNDSSNTATVNTLIVGSTA